MSNITKSEEDYNLFDWWKKAIIANYANFTGRARRKEYWMTTLANFIIILPIYILFIFSSLQMSETGEPSILFWITYAIFMLFALALMIPSIALVVRRLHDVGKSGWFYLLGIIPFVNFYVLYLVWIADSQNGENKWGPNPKGIGNQNNLNQIGVQEE
jgi:uncharacterized membrane protein YhaH (DUF805 family)